MVFPIFYLYGNSTLVSSRSSSADGASYASDGIFGGKVKSSVNSTSLEAMVVASSAVIGIEASMRNVTYDDSSLTSNSVSRWISNRNEFYMDFSL